MPSFDPKIFKHLAMEIFEKLEMWQANKNFINVMAY